MRKQIFRETEYIEQPEWIAGVGPARVELSKGKKLKSSKNSIIFVWRTSSWQLTQNGLSLAVIEKLKEMSGMQSDKVRSLLLSYYVCEFRILNNFFKTLTQEKKSPDFKVSNSNQSFNQIGKKIPGRRQFLKKKRRYNDCAKNSVKAKWSSRGF